MEKKKRKMVLTDEENEIESSIAKGEWASVDSHEKKKYKTILEKAARSTISGKKKEARVNIRMTVNELDMVRAEAEREGIPYQTLMSSILHKYLTGELIDKKVVKELKKVLTARLVSQ